jgi:holo-[acyl-carrier protein] synthase
LTQNLSFKKVKEMIYGVGVDIVDVSRIKKVIERQGERFVNRVFTDSEIRYCEGRRFKHQHFAARFAAKEAFLKAIGGRGVCLRDIEIEVKEFGKPTLKLYRKIEKLIKELGVNIHLSLSHCSEYALAYVVLEIIEK